MQIVAIERAGIGPFEQILILHERQVYLTALRLLGRREDAQDAAQEVFLRLHRHLGRLDQSRELSPWLYRVTVNVCRDLARERLRHAGPPPADSYAADGPDPQGEAGLAERRRLITEALGKLPEKERAAIVLRDIEGLSTREVARILGSAEVTVRSQISSARRKMRGFIEKTPRGAAMNCRRFEELFALHVEGDLPERKRRAVDEHMAGCEACRDFAARLEASQRAVKDLRDEAVDAEALEEIRGRVLARIAADAPAPRFSWRFAYAAAAVLAVAAVVWVSRRAPEPPPPLPRPVASMPAPALPEAVPKPPVRRAVRKPRPVPKPRPEPLLVKLETSDPNVVIYWIVESGE